MKLRLGATAGASIVPTSVTSGFPSTILCVYVWIYAAGIRYATVPHWLGSRVPGTGQPFRQVSMQNDRVPMQQEMYTYTNCFFSRCPTLSLRSRRLFKSNGLRGASRWECGCQRFAESNKKKRIEWNAGVFLHWVEETTMEDELTSRKRNWKEERKEPGRERPRMELHWNPLMVARRVGSAGTEGKNEDRAATPSDPPTLYL